MSLAALRMPFAALAALVLVIFGAAAPAAAAQCEAASYVQRAGEAYDRAAQSGSPQAFASAASRFTDLRALSLFALGRYRKDLPKSRESEYFALTRSFIGSFMLRYGTGFRASDLSITSCERTGGGLVVSARLSTGGKVTFRIAGSGGNYSIKDLNMKGIWLAQQMRSTFVGTISNTGSIDGLFAYLKR